MNKEKEQKEKIEKWKKEAEEIDKDMEIWREFFIKEKKKIKVS